MKKAKFALEQRVAFRLFPEANSGLVTARCEYADGTVRYEVSQAKPDGTVATTWTTETELVAVAS